MDIATPVLPDTDSETSIIDFRPLAGRDRRGGRLGLRLRVASMYTEMNSRAWSSHRDHADHFSASGEGGKCYEVRAAHGKIKSTTIRARTGR